MNNLKVGDTVFQVDFDNEPTDIGISLFIRKLYVIENGETVKMVMPYNENTAKEELSVFDIYESRPYCVFHDLERAKEFASVLLLGAKDYD